MESFAGDATILWTANDRTTSAELTVMSIRKRYFDAVHAFKSNAPLTHNTLLLLEVMDFFPIGVFINHPRAATATLSSDSARDLFQDVHALAIASI